MTCSRSILRTICTYGRMHAGYRARNWDHLRLPLKHPFEPRGLVRIMEDLTLCEVSPFECGWRTPKVQGVYDREAREDDAIML
jgi:hypothetical protein